MPGYIQFQILGHL